MHDIIIDAAVELFLAEGYEQTSMRKIAQKIEYTPGAIYSYFKDKDEILYEIHARGFTKLFEQLRVALEETNPLDKLYKTGQLYIKFALENREYYELMFIDRSILRSCFEKKEWEEGHAAYNVLVQIIGECIEKGLLPNVDIHAASYGFWSMVHGLVALVLRGRCMIVGTEPQEQLIHASYDFIWQAMKRKK
jgi:AcrR family transcriptional regulator